MIKKINLLLLFSLLNIVLKAQDIHLQSLRTNAKIIEYRKNLPAQHATQLNRTQSTSAVSLTLPFYDEFSYAGPYPDSTKWQNSQSVYVNHTKAIAPPTLGVATFDGLDKYGYPYNPALTSAQSGGAAGNNSDTMASKPIGLDILGGHSGGPADSVYLSFYYEGRGYWDKPELGDELRLDFYNPVDNAWDQVWNHAGSQYDPDSTWHIVMIPILDADYFKNNFQFRFTNLSSGSGDVDHWHIDVVSLDYHRNHKDTIFPDHAFVYDLPSALKNYTQMPFRQYTGANDMKTNIHAFLRNNDNSILNENVATNYSSYNNTTASYLYQPPAEASVGSANLPYYYNNGYCTANNVIDPALSFSYPLMTDSNSYTMKFYLTNPDAHPLNDTISFRQDFSNYYSYDDGSAESGFTVGSPNGTGNHKAAVKYTLTNTDTLRAMDIFFDPIADVNLIKNSPFNILVWADNGGVPGNVIYTDSMHHPYFPSDTIVQGVSQRKNNFLRYQFKHPVYLNGGTTFYIGINQIYPAPQITIGFDRNTDFHRNMFYNSNSSNWYVLPGDLDFDYRGSLMIHPVFGDSLETLSIKDYTAKNTAGITLYPNPATDNVSVQCDHTISKIIVTDLLGNIILQQTASSSVKNINTLSLQSGVYLVKAFTDDGFADTQKLMIVK